MSKLYKEEDSYFYSDGTLYELNPIFAATVNLPLQEIEIKDLEWCLNEYNLKFQRLNGVDLDIPILVIKQKDSTSLLIDGEHRVFKAKETGRSHLSCYFIPLEVLESAKVS